VAQANQPSADPNNIPPSDVKNPKLQSAQIFISYSRSDRLAVDRLAADLRRQNYLLWMDVSEHGIEPGEDWQAELVKQMSASEAVIACASPDFLTSPHCRAEIEQARRENKPIYPVIVRRLGTGDSLAAVQLDNLQFIDLTQDYDDRLKRLASALPRPRFPTRTIARRAGIAALVTVALILLLAGVMYAASLGTYVSPTQTPIATQTPHFAGNETGVLVSYFVLGDNTSAEDTAAANALIEGFSGALQNELDSIQKANNDKGLFVIHVVGPQGIAPVTGADSQTRRADAGVLADRRPGTAVVVYGLISRNAVTRQFEVQPEFYVAPGKHFADAQDIVGGYAIGKDIRVDPANSISSQSAFVARIRALAYVIEGLSQHVLRNYEKALAAYQSAMDVPGWKDEPGEGREVLYTLIGNTHMRLAEKAASACIRDTVLQEVATAVEQFNTSRDLNDKYVRAYAGLANTAFFSAWWSPKGNDGCKERKVVTNSLREALNYLDQAQTATPASDAATVMNLLLNEAQIRFTLWLQNSNDDGLRETFLGVTDKIIAKYDRRDGIAVAFPAMETRILRGVYRQTRAASGADNYRDAIGEYEDALAIYNDGSFKDLFAPARAMAVYGLEGDCYLGLADYTNADKFYNLALKMAEALDNQAQVNAYRARLKALDVRRLGTATPTVLPSVPSPTSAPSSDTF
jgi:tetratricopeptide (TPR) repeat protein